MKKTLLALGLATGLVVPLFAGETLHLNLVPDRDVLLKGRSQEVVVKIDLSAIADRQKHERRRAGGGKWLRHRHRPGFLPPAGLLREVRNPGMGIRLCCTMARPAGAIGNGPRKISVWPPGLG
jgi:hypothetical protein